MESEQQETLVFKGQAGEYYLLPQATLERGRVPTEHKAEVERLIAEAEGDDVSGHLPFLAGVLIGVILGGGAAAATVAYELNDDKKVCPVPD